MPNTITLAKELGHKSAGTFGEMVFEEMQCAFLLKAMKHPKFTSGFTSGRVRENILFVTPPGWMKSFSTDTFIKKCMGAIPVTDIGKPGLPKPVFLQLDGGAITPESLRGGATNTGKLIPPLVTLGDFLYSTDLPTFLGSGERRDNCLKMILLLAEDGEFDAFLLKMEEFDEEEAAEFEQKCAGWRGVSYIASPRRGFKLTSATPFIFCCTPEELSNESRTSIEKSAPGFRSRFTVRSWAPSDKDAKDIWQGDLADVEYAPLRSLNLQAWRTTLKELPIPSRSEMEYAVDFLIREAESIAHETDLPLHKIINMRHKMRIARLMAAHAFARALEERDQDNFDPIDTLRYNSDDAIYAARRIAEQLIVAAEAAAEEDEDHTRGADNSATRIYMTYLKHLKKEMPRVCSRKGFIEYCERIEKKSKKTAYNYLTELKRLAVYRRGGYNDEMVNDEKWLEANGFSDQVARLNRLRRQLVELE